MSHFYQKFVATCFALAIIVGVGAPSASAQSILIGYDTTNPNGSNGTPSPDLAAADVGAGINALLFSRGPGLTPNQGITLNSSDWSTSNSLDLNSDDYLQWGWSSSSQLYDLTDLIIQYDRSPSGPSQLAIAVSIDGGPNQVIFSDSDVLIGDENAEISLSGFDGVTSAQFRLFGFDASNSGGTLDIEELDVDPIFPNRGIIVRGTISAIPEPSAALLGWFVVVGIGVRRCRKV